MSYFMCLVCIFVHSYYTNPYFVVEFGPPTDKDEYEEQNDDSLDDDALEADDAAKTDDSKK